MDDNTHGSFIDIPFVRSVKEVRYAKRYVRVILKASAYGLSSSAAEMEFWCGRDHARNE